MKEYLYLTIINYSLLLNEFERAFVGFFLGGRGGKIQSMSTSKLPSKVHPDFFFIILSVFT